ncbi:methyltransferase domain-containing protein [Kitasatospora sp. NBC_01302]|uniref:methyltransferase domain-containing protein n=1 Tax=Kitasatospora sp. NBC_01302 TaxID=2903575 RepID=UPI002E15B2C4|nr:methyltransferase domain-containing protein [Kitasatospora sp. NBC_01302]
MTTTNQDRLGRAPGRSFPVPTPWAATFEAVPRALFLPDLMWAHDMAAGTSVPVDRTANLDAWATAAQADIPIITQWDDGQHAGREPGVVPTSSASMPSVVAGMLDDLDVQPGMRVLEIGTGTGWNAALLARHLGDQAVTTIEVDPAVATDASHHLSAAGLHPKVIVGDGADGYSPGAPYDRVIATCGMRSIPYSWVEQTRPSGIILAPWGTHFGNGDALVRLTVGRDGTASGPFLRPVEFMKMRSQRLVWPQPPTAGGTVSEGTTRLVLPAHHRFAPFPFALGLRLPDVTHAVQPHDDGETLWLYSLAETEPAWSATEFRGGDVHRVQQYGARRLWDEVEAAHDWWQDQGRPGFDRFGLTVDQDGERSWLDHPDNPVRAR